MTSKLMPPKLQKGDLVAIVAPSGKLYSDNLDQAIVLLQSWDLEVVVGKYVWDNYFSFAAIDEKRQEDFQTAIDTPEIKAIFCARGGYGVSRIIDSLNFDTFKKKPKWIIGFSDITAFHAHLYTLGFQSLHACMPSQYHGKCTFEAVESIRKALFETPINLNALANPSNKLGEVTGTLAGGNLCLINDMIGTKSDFETEKTILYIEEINEPLYSIDRMFTHLNRIGKLEKLAGLVVGDLDTKPNHGNEFGITLEDIILEKVGKYNYPVGFNFPIGHRPHNIAVINGANAHLKVTGELSSLTFSL